MFEEVAPGEGRQDGLDPLAAAELKERTVAWHAKVIAEAGRLAAGRHAGTQREPITPQRHRTGRPQRRWPAGGSQAALVGCCGLRNALRSELCRGGLGWLLQQ